MGFCISDGSHWWWLWRCWRCRHGYHPSSVADEASSAGGVTYSVIYYYLGQVVTSWMVVWCSGRHIGCRGMFQSIDAPSRAPIQVGFVGGFSCAAASWSEACGSGWPSLPMQPPASLRRVSARESPQLASSWPAITWISIASGRIHAVTG